MDGALFIAVGARKRAKQLILQEHASDSMFSPQKDSNVE